MQIYGSTLQMGFVAGVLAKLRTHDWRRGAAKELANLKTRISGVADQTIARGIGQSRLSLSKGITDDYVGDIEADLYAARVASDFQSKRTPAIGAPFKKLKLNPEEVKKYCEENGIDSSKSGIRTARRHLYAEQVSGWIEEEKNRHEPPTALRATPQQQLTQSLAQRTANQINSALVSSEQLQIGGPGLLNQSSSAASSTTTAAREVQGFMRFIDPQLLLNPGDQFVPLEEALDASAAHGDGIDADVQQIVNALEDINVSTGDPEGDRDSELIGLGMILENMQMAKQSADILLLPGSKFVDAFSKINIVHNTQLNSHQTTLGEAFPLKVPMGNSRDYPSLFQFHCPNEGCSHQNSIKVRVSDHVLVCKPQAKTSKSFLCDRLDSEGELCNKAFGRISDLNQHVTNVRNWVPKKCIHDNCPVPDTMFEDGKKYANHLAIHHKPIDPTTCTFPACVSKIIFVSRWLYSRHLRQVHKLMSAKSQQKYLPEQPGKTYHWLECACPLGGALKCATVFKSCRGLRGHLTSKVHKLSADEAKKITDEIAGGAESEDRNQGDDENNEDDKEVLA
jgi:hypothetical protein